LTAKIYITLKSGVLDPQGKAVQRSLARLGFSDAGDVRVGKYIEVRLDGTSAAEAPARVEAMCKELLANTVIEDFRFELAP
jgi:phosphoribosylformylglycinamidine synthase